MAHASAGYRKMTLELQLRKTKKKEDKNEELFYLIYVDFNMLHAF